MIMSEMLANHFFLIRDYNRAIKTYEKAALSIGITKTIRKKIIICYVKTLELEKALNEFLKLLEEDMDFITNTDINSDDCPCPDIISEVERGEIDFADQYEKNISLGILWLYCDKKQSLLHFRKAYALCNKDKRLRKAIHFLN